jgi:predicted esterase YcpF (UPF0227 family)
MILYLHGFLSSPNSRKARLLADALRDRGHEADYVCPALPLEPSAAQAMILNLILGVDANQLVVVGSSLGGFYATWLAEHSGCRACLINPAVHPYDALADQVGAHRTDAQGHPVVVLPEHLRQLRTMAVAAVTRPDRYHLIAATGDEVLDYRDMLSFYRDCPTTLVQGSDHALSDFERHLPSVLAFCLPPGPQRGG